MPVKPALLLCVSLASGCGDDLAGTSDWMVGVYSDRMPGLQNSHDVYVDQYEIRADGTFLVHALRVCGSNTFTEKAYTWEHLDADTIKVKFPEGAPGGFEAWHISRGKDCNEILVGYENHGEVFVEVPYQRGAVCLERVTCPSGTVECDYCKTVWCDEPPPPCADE